MNEPVVVWTQEAIDAADAHACCGGNCSGQELGLRDAAAIQFADEADQNELRFVIGQCIRLVEREVMPVEGSPEMRSLDMLRRALDDGVVLMRGKE